MFPSCPGRGKRKCHRIGGGKGRVFVRLKAGGLPAQKRAAARWPPPLTKQMQAGQARRVSTKFWPDEEVQFNWLVDTSRQLKLTGVWRINDVPLISTEVGPVIV